MPKSRLELNFPAQVDLRALAAVSRFCGTDDNRTYLMGVRVEIGPRDVVYVATDGKRLLALRQEKLRDDPDNDLTGRFTIPTLHCRAFKLKKDQDPTAELYGDEERLTIKRGDVEVTFTPLQDGEFIGRWVDWRHVIPRPARTAEAGQFDHAQLATFQKFADEMPGGYYPCVVDNGRDGGALVRFSNMDAIGVVVPVKVDDQRTAPLPSWAVTEDFRSWDRYRSRRDAEDDVGDTYSADAQNLGDAADDLVDRLRAGQGGGQAEKASSASHATGQSASSETGDALTAEHQADAPASAGDDLAAGHQAAALGDTGAQDALTPEQRANVDRLEGIQQLQPGDGEPIEDGDAGEDAGQEQTASGLRKPKRRGRRSAEQRTADNARAADAGRMI